jgi:hypothetical protein
LKWREMREKMRHCQRGGYEPSAKFKKLNLVKFTNPEVLHKVVEDPETLWILAVLNVY